jgi:hypothetical protein
MKFLRLFIPTPRRPRREDSGETAESRLARQSFSEKNLGGPAKRETGGATHGGTWGFVGAIAAAMAGFFICQTVYAVNTPASVTVIVVPDAPTNLAAYASSQSDIDLSWTDNSNNETGFSVERSIGSDANFIPLATTTQNVTVYSDTGLSPDTTYFYRVDAYDADGGSLYSNEASATTQSAPIPPSPPPPPSSGGGGGGGSYGFRTSAIFRGIAYPLSDVTLLENAQVVAVTQSGPDAKFEVDLSNIPPGTYNFGVWAKDPNGNRSIMQTFSIMLTNGATTIISGVFFPPTISADKTQVKRGDVLNILGYTAPQVTISVIVNSNNEIVKNVTSSDSGAWLYRLNTSALDYGNHTAHAWAVATDGNMTANSNLIAFTVGNESISAQPNSSCTVLIGDLNGDCRVNIVDFSIMAYWYERTNPPAMVDLNHDGKINLVDFSILAYYWTG